MVYKMSYEYAFGLWHDFTSSSLGQFIQWKVAIQMCPKSRTGVPVASCAAPRLETVTVATKKKKKRRI